MSRAALVGTLALGAAACSGGAASRLDRGVSADTAITGDAVAAPIDGDGGAPTWPVADAIILQGAVATPWRARQVAESPGWLRQGGERADGERVMLPHAEELIVAEAQGDAVRVLAENHDARLLVWIPRGDLETLVVAPITTEAGHTLLPGLAVTATPDGAGRVSVRAQQDALVVTTSAPASALGEVWREPEVTPQADTLLAPATPIRATPAAAAAAYVTTTDEVWVRRLAGARDGFVEIESIGRLRYRGWVPDDAAPATPYGDLIGRVAGGVGVGCRPRLDVVAGACLYDAVDGEVIGLHLTERARCAGEVADGWWQIDEWTPAGSVGPLLHAVDAGDDLEFDVCEGE